LNEQASAYVAPGGDPNAPRVFDHPGLRVSAASPEHLLAMKVLAARRRDAEDIRFLVKHLHLASAQEVLALVAVDTRGAGTVRTWAAPAVSRRR